MRSMFLQGIELHIIVMQSIQLLVQCLCVLVLSFTLLSYDIGGYDAWIIGDLVLVTNVNLVRGVLELSEIENLTYRDCQK